MASPRSLLPRRSLRRGAALVAAIGAFAMSLLAGVVAGEMPPVPTGSLGAAGFDGFATNRVESVDTPARIARVAVVPGSGGSEVWGFGDATSAQAGWNPAEQVVFLRRQPAGGWEIDGPPLISRPGAPDEPQNPNLTAMAMAATGEGWAVGTGGMLVHRKPGDRWRVESLCPNVTCSDLYNVTVSPAGDRGFIVGRDGKVLRLADGAWKVDDRPVAVPTGGNQPSLVDVALGAGDEAWAIASSAAVPASRRLEIYQRTASNWAPVATGKNYLDDAGPVVIGGSQVRFTVKGMSVESTPDGSTVWFGGSLSPADPANPTGDPSTAGSSDRPFALRRIGGAWRAYCPPVYTTSGEQAAETQVCDAPMPTSTYGVQSLSIAGTDVFAGGFGLYHYRAEGDVWFREPNPVGRVGSVSFASATEGWFASAASSITHIAESRTTAVGHYTNKPLPARSRLARWPIPTTNVVYGAAISPTNSGPPIAVGQSGTLLAHGPLGWQQRENAGPRTLLAAAYIPGTNQAWAVGEAGRVAQIVDGDPGETYEVPNRGARREHFYAVAFSSTGIGWAVGANGAMAYWDGGKWAQRGTSGVTTHLYSIDVTPAGGFIAAGAGGTVIHNSGGGWDRVDSVDAIYKDVDPKPALYAIDAFPGGFAAGGSDSALLIGDASANFTLSASPPGGTILALQGRKDGEIVNLVASVTPHGVAKYSNARSDVTRGWLATFDGRRWHDEQNSNTTKLHPSLDEGITRDPILTIVAEPGGRSGWAVGGRPFGVSHETDMSDLPTGSIYRFDLVGDARPPKTEAEIAPDPPPAGGMSFAFFSDTSCGSTLCSLSIGTGTTADQVALRIRDDINAMVDKARLDPTKEEGAPKFVLFGGSARGAGTREEIAAFAGYVAGFKIPVYGAVGTRDLTLPAAAADPELPSLGYNLAYPVDVESQTRSTGSNRFWGEELRHMPRPWGHTNPDPAWGIRPVPNAVSPSTTRALTHYAFDYAPGGRTLGRFVILDTSTRSLATTGQNPQEAQTAFLSSVMVNAGAPTFVVMNVPPRDPMSVGNTALYPGAESNTLEQSLFGYGTSAVFTGGIRTNASYNAPEGLRGGVPIYVAGSGGAPMTGSKWPTDGHYHSWLHVTTGAPVADGVSTRAPVTVRPIPVLDSISLSAPNLVVSGGSGARFDALARAIDGGAPAKDGSAAFRTYMNFPVLGRCDGDGEKGVGPTSCFNRRALIPDFRFVSEDPTIADFVRAQDNSRSSPLLVNGRVVPDPRSGFLCTYKTGQVWVRIESGGRQARLPVTVIPGKGRCVDDPVNEPPDIPLDNVEPKDEPVPNVPPGRVKPAKVVSPAPPAKPAPPAPPPPAVIEPAPPAKPIPKPFVPPSPLGELAAALVPPAPSLIPSPAPPASASAAGAEKQDEKEVEHESAGQEGGDFTAIQHDRASQYDAMSGLMLAAAAAMFGVFGAAIASTVKSGARAAYQPVTYPKDLR
ncbi:MAG TPA: hypothetical protein VF230_06935 [Acidimicrobiales bacterium]